MPNKYERFVAAYLRLNAYFEVQNFIVHAGDDPTRVSSGQVGNYTECDTLGIRMPHSDEVAGHVHIANHRLLTDGVEGRLDVIVAEAKSGNENRPNKMWRAGMPDPAISYIVRFIGVHPEGEVRDVAKSLAMTFRFEDDLSRYRYILFSNQPNDHYASKGVTYITYRDAARFIVEIRGQSWIEGAIGVASVHQQWDEMLIEIFGIANAHERSIDQRTNDIESFLAT
jgi:hypothetical protein